MCSRYTLGAIFIERWREVQLHDPPATCQPNGDGAPLVRDDVRLKVATATFLLFPKCVHFSLPNPSPPGTRTNSPIRSLTRFSTKFSQDPNARVACETLVNTGLVLVAGEITTTAYVDVQQIARDVILDVGYDSADACFDGRTCAVVNAIEGQSPDIAQGVDTGGAGDQGLMFGYACDDTSELMPLPISLAHQLTARLTEVRKSGELPWLRPDGKSQVTLEYVDGVPMRVDTVVVSAQHDPEIEIDELRTEILEKVIRPICGEWLDDRTIFHINPTGRFVIGGPQGDCGMTGRKIIVDTYGG